MSIVGGHDSQPEMGRTDGSGRRSKFGAAGGLCAPLDLVQAHAGTRPSMRSTASRPSGRRSGTLAAVREGHDDLGAARAGSPSWRPCRPRPRPRGRWRNRSR